MAWTRTRTGRNGRITYQGLYRDIHGRRHSSGTSTNQRTAERKAGREETDHQAGTISDPRRGRQKFGDYIENDWFPNHIIEQSTRETYRNRLDSYIIPELGDLRLAKPPPNDSRRWIAKLQSEEYGASPATIEKCKTVVDAALTTAWMTRSLGYTQVAGQNTSCAKTATTDRYPRTV